MDSDLHRQQYHNHNHNQQQQSQPMMNSGLTRYRSAPSSYFSDVISGLFADDDTDQFFSSTSRASNAQTDSFSNQILNQVGGFESQFMGSVKQEQEGIYSESQQQQQQQQQPIIYQNQNQFQSLTDHNNQTVSTCSSTADNSLTSMNLPRQNSSPAGFFAHLDMDHGYPLMRSTNDFRGGRSIVPNSMAGSAKRMKNEYGISSGSQLSSGKLPRIPENEAKVVEMKSTRNDGGFGSSSWDDSDIFSDSFLKEFGESDQNKLSSLDSSDNQDNDVRRIRAPATLVHHLSLPASTAELDKLMQFQDTVPFKSRAKRGCATHPRSIAERVRRTRISERMKKLQDLVPNMDKQTNTADMLDLAVDYIKELQKEAETLSNHHAKCTCPHKQKL